MTEQVKNYIAEDVVEEVYAGLTIIAGATTVPAKVASGKIGSGYNAVIVSVAANQNNNVWVWVKKKDKQVYENGLSSAALPANLGECPVYKDVLEHDAWEFGITNTGAPPVTVAWLIRIRLFRKGSRR